MQPRILGEDRGGEQLTPSSGTGVHCQGLHQNNAAFLYDKWHLHGIKGKFRREKPQGLCVRLQDGAESDLQ